MSLSNTRLTLGTAGKVAFLTCARAARPPAGARCYRTVVVGK
ncbi:MAG: hypothetical protein ABR881_01355 [Candidatus Sulfotelmatobacter sp.]